jgi:hypothetical protein
LKQQILQTKSQFLLHLARSIQKNSLTIITDNERFPAAIDNLLQKIITTHSENFSLELQIYELTQQKLMLELLSKDFSNLSEPQIIARVNNTSAIFQNIKSTETSLISQQLKLPDHPHESSSKKSVETLQNQEGLIDNLLGTIYGNNDS